MSAHSDTSRLSVQSVKGDHTAWDRYVASHPAATHMHQSAWAGIFERVFGHKTSHWVARDTSGEIHGVLPLTTVRSALFGARLVSVPFLNYGGPIGDSEAIDVLVNHVSNDATRLGIADVELRSRGRLPISLEPSIEKVTVVLALPTSEALLMKQFDPKLRSQIRRATKEGASVHFGRERLTGFYSVFAEHMRDLGTPVMPRRFFEDIADTFGDSAWIATVEYEGRAIAGAMGFRWRNEFEITWASSLNRYKRFAPNMCLYGALMNRCIGDGVERFNFGRTTPGSGPHRFKLQWGGSEEPLHWYYPGKRGAQARPKKEQGHFALAAKLWSRLPLSVAGVLGPRIVRGLP